MILVNPNVCRDAQEAISCVVQLTLFFNSRCTELFMASVGSEKKKKNNKKNQNLKITSQSFHFTSDPWQLQSAVIVRWYLKQRHGLTDLTFVYIIVKLQTYCIFSSYVLSLFFLLLLMTCMEYVSVTASALVMGKSKQSHWFSLDSVCY